MYDGRGRWLPLLAWLLACWPLLAWFAGRAGASDDLASGLMAVGAAVVLTVRAARANAAPTPRGGWWPAALAMGVNAAAQPFLPMTLCGLPAVAALLLAPGPWRRGRWPDPAVAGLLILALPTTMMLELFLGYPLRVVASAFAAGILQGAGLPVTRAGVELIWAGLPVWVDAPCSGIRMLWGGVWLVLATAGLSGLSWRRTGVAGVLAVVVVVLANAVRVTVLCLASAGVLPSGEPLHTGMGVAVFVAGVALIVGIVHVLSRHDVPPTACASGTADAAGAGRVAFVLACLAAALIQLLPAPTPATGIGDAAFPGWPATFEERALRQTPLTPQEAAFNTAFPGRIARFEDGSRVLIWRWVTRPTHRVHAATDCLRSSGWRITPLPLRGDTGGPWSCFLAERRGVRLQVRERCTAPDGRTWPDVPAWFWAAWLGRSTGPWQVITVAERAYGTMP